MYTTSFAVHEQYCEGNMVGWKIFWCSQEYVTKIKWGCFVLCSWYYNILSVSVSVSVSVCLSLSLCLCLSDSVSVSVSLSSAPIVPLKTLKMVLNAMYSLKSFMPVGMEYSQIINLFKTGNPLDEENLVKFGEKWFMCRELLRAREIQRSQTCSNLCVAFYTTKLTYKQDTVPSNSLHIQHRF